MKGEEGHLCTKSMGILPCTPLEVWFSQYFQAAAFLNLVKYKQEFDDLFEAGEILEDFPNGTSISTEKYHGKLFASPRDFIFIHQTKLDPSDGTVQLPAVSIVDPKYPVIKKYVRGKIFVRLEH